MARELTFNQVCDFVRSEAKKEPKLIEATDILLGLALICAPVAIGPAAALLLPTLAIKNDLIKIGKTVFERLAKKKDTDHLARLLRMEVGYRLICFTAYFDALDGALPPAFRERLKLLPSEKGMLAADALGVESCTADASQTKLRIPDLDNPIADVAISLPHPTEGIEEHVMRLTPVWKRMSQGFRDFVGKLAIAEEMDEKAHAELQAAVETIPAAAALQYQAQYFELCCKFPEFAVWANLQEHHQTRARLKELPAYFQAYLKLTGDAIDVGLSRLQLAVATLPEAIKAAHAEELVRGLSTHYSARLNEPIVDDRDGASEGDAKLRFPHVKTAFVPQAFRVLRVSAGVRRLEDDGMWNAIPKRNDLGAFLLRYLTSPYSTDAPLLVLGHPGGGKSLLTTVLAAQLMSRQFTVVRVPLREVNAESGVVAQIEEAIRRITSVSTDPWSKLSAAFKNNPPVVILDGYDELLQASGKVFANYLVEVQNFQRNEAEQRRPVRVIVTSRVTLIDKATIPQGATVLRLLEFDKARRDRWIGTWNKANTTYFEQTSTRPFALPSETDQGAEKILSLAEQPLLLLMLALYDSQSNQLRESKSLDRTRLYDSLLRRFVEREKRKDATFHGLDKKDRDKLVDNEMQRLSVAALGMYNRRQVHILATDLDADLKFFELERRTQVASGRPMTQAELLLGSFFFVHKSESHERGANSGIESYAFEFLHNTFGEFLTADFIVRRTVRVTAALIAIRGSEDLLAQLERMLNSADGFPRQWIASLIYTPLFSRPVVMDMMREWAPHVLAERALTMEGLVDEYDNIVMNQLNRLLSRREMPSMIYKETVDEVFRVPFGEYPLVGHVVIYSLNLLLLRVTLSDGPFILDESKIKTHDDGARPWDRLTHLWRSWFSLENLNGLTGALSAQRDGGRVVLRSRPAFQIAEGRDRLETFFNVSVAIADDISAGLSGLAHYERADTGHISLGEVQTRLASEKIDREFEVQVRELRWAARKLEPKGILAFLGGVSSAVRAGLTSGLPPDALESVCLVLRIGVRQVSRTSEERSEVRGLVHESDVVSSFVSGQLFRELIERSPASALLWVQAVRELGGRSLWQQVEPDLVERMLHEPRFMIEGRSRDPEAALAWVQIVREVAGKGSWRRFGARFVDRMFHPRFLIEIAEWSPEAAVEWVRLVRELGGDDRMFPRMGAELFERFVDARFLMDLIERSPEAAVAWTKLVRDLGGTERLLRSADPDLVRRFLDPRFLLELSERSPEAGGAWVRLIRELGVEPLLARMGPEAIHVALDPGFLLELAERSPEAAAFWIQIARQVGGLERLKHRVEPHILRRLLDPRFLLDLNERSPQSAVFWLEVVRELGALPELASRLDPEMLRHLVSPRFLRDIGSRNTESVAAWLELVRAFGGDEALRRSVDPEALEGLLDPRLLLDLAGRDPDAAFSLVRTVFDTGLADRAIWGRDGRDGWLSPRSLIEISERSAGIALFCLERLDSAEVRHHPGRWREAVDLAIIDWARRGRPSTHPGGFLAAARLARMWGSLAARESVAKAFVEVHGSRGVLLAAAPYPLLVDLGSILASIEAPDLREALGGALPDLPAALAATAGDGHRRRCGPP